MATITLERSHFFKGGQLSDRAIVIDTGHTLVRGQMVLIASSKLQEATTSSAKIAGLAEEGGAAAESVKYRKYTKGDILVMHVYHSNAASKITATTQYMVEYGIIEHPDDATICAVNLEDTSTTRVRVIGFYCDHDTDEAMGDTNGRVLVEVLEDYIQ